MSKKSRNRARMSKENSNVFSGLDWESWARRLQLILALVVPFAFLEGLYNYVDLPRAVLIQSAVVSILLIWLLGAVAQNKLRILRTPFDHPLLGFVSWAGLSLLWANNFYEGFEIWTQWSACLIVFFLTVNLIQSERDIRRLLEVLLLAGTFVAFLGICQYFFGVNWVPQTVPPAATFANRNLAAQFMVMTIPLAFGLFLLSRKWSHVLWTVLALGAVILFLFYSSTRAAWLAVTVEFFLLVLLLGRNHFKWKLAPQMGTGKKQALVVCAVVVFLLFNLTPSGFQWQVGTAFQRIREVLPQESQRHSSPENAAQAGAQTAQLAASPRDSLSVRIRLWRNTLQMGTEHLLSGVGVGNFPVFYPRYVRSAVVDPVFSGRSKWVRAHNDYVQTFAELGLVGLFFLGWLLFAVMKTSIAVMGKETRKELRYLVMGVILGLAGLCVIAFFSFPFRLATPTFVFALYLGVLGGHYSRQQLQEKNSVSGREAFISLPAWVATVGVAVTFVFLLILLPFEYNRLKADGYYKRVDTAARTDVWAEVISQANEGYQRYPYRKDFLFALGPAYYGTGNTEAAIESMEEFLAAYPYDVNAHHNLGVAYVRKGDLDQALQQFNRVFEMIPQYGVTHYAVAQLYARRNELDQALEHYRLAVQDQPNNALFQGKLGSMALTQELFSEAQEALERALKNDPDNSVYYLDLGIAAGKLRKPEEARAAFGKAVELNPQSAVAHFNLGMLLSRVFEEKEEGIEHLKKALNLELSATYAAEARELIENVQQQ